MGLQLVVPLWLLQPSLLFYISQVHMSSLGPHPIIFPPKVQKVLKSLLEKGQAFIKREQSCCFFAIFIFSAKKKRHRVALAVVYFKLPPMLCFLGQTPVLLQTVDSQHVADCSPTGSLRGLDYIVSNDSCAQLDCNSQIPKCQAAHKSETELLGQVHGKEHMSLW